MSAADEKIFTDVQRQTFQYFWDGAEPTSGLARERFHVDNVYPQNDKSMLSPAVVAGFGVMAILWVLKEVLLQENREENDWKRSFIFWKRQIAFMVHGRIGGMAKQEK